ncbi:reverse transcriptase [Tanacetum coccineum]
MSLAELWYNSNFHTSIQTTPFEAVYGQSPSIYVPYLGGLNKVDAVDTTLEAREQVIQMLKFHLSSHTDRCLLDKADRMVKKNYAAVVYGLAQWANMTKEDATWEILEELYAKFPSFDAHS